MCQGTLPNYYALMISIVKGYPAEKSLQMMGIPIVRTSANSVRHKGIYREKSEQCAVIRSCTGASFREIGRMLGIHYETVQHAIENYKENLAYEVMH